MANSTQKSQYRPSEVFTPEMRDRQARGKNPYGKSEASEDSDMSEADARMSIGQTSSSETFADRERKGEAMSVLDNPEALMAHAQAQGDSISGQRLRFMRQLCGYDEKPQDRTGGGNTGTPGSGRKNRRVSDRGGR